MRFNLALTADPVTDVVHKEHLNISSSPVVEREKNDAQHNEG